MAIRIDVDRLESTGAISSDVANMLRQHALRDTGSAAINSLLAFGAIAVAAGILTLLPKAIFGVVIGFLFVALGWYVGQRFAQNWGKLGSIWMVVGALILSGALGALINHPFTAPLIIAFILMAVSILARSHLLMALVPIAIIAAIGGSTGYWHACYMISVQEPTLTIILFSVFSIAAWQLSKKLKGAYQQLTITFARMSVILINMGFWIGSLWGDSPGHLWNNKTNLTYQELNMLIHPQIPALIFAVLWAVAILLAAVWGAGKGRRFLVNTLATFGAIHFYTQWFEYLGAHAWSVIIAGLLTILLGLGLWSYNKKLLYS